MEVLLRRDRVDGFTLKWLAIAGANWLERWRDEINRMNVFPVPDGDTGTNMFLTIRKATQDLAATEEIAIDRVAQTLAKGALLGARGNSGTIFSMLLQGFAQRLDGHAVMDARLMAQAVQHAVDYAYETITRVTKPVEGTILTVARAASASLMQAAQNETDLRILLEVMLKGARNALARTPEQLPVLKAAGVVDSGGLGLVIFIEGMRRALDGEPVADQTSTLSYDLSMPARSSSLAEALAPQDPEGYGYDVQFLLRGEQLDIEAVREVISAMGWSALVDGDAQLVKVHVHVHDPGQPLSYAISLGGELDDVVVENMQRQYEDYLARQTGAGASALLASSSPGRGVDAGHPALVAVVVGDGFEQIFLEYGATAIVTGGQTMNPSTEQILEAVQGLAATDVIILPNNPNIIMAAQQAARLSTSQRVRVVPTRTLPQGLAALLAFGDRTPDPNLEALCQQMLERSQSLLTLALTQATRVATIDGVSARPGDWIVVVDDDLKAASDDLLGALSQALSLLNMDDYELATLYTGVDAMPGEMSRIQLLFEETGNLETEVLYGGQPLYPYIVSLE